MKALAKRVPVDHRTDIYSLGVTLYELLALEPAFNGRDRQELLRQNALEEARPLRRIRRSIPPELETIVGKAIPRVDAYERLSGAAIYPLDVLLPDMLYAATLRCPHAHALVKKVDLAKAGQMPGVRAVITGATPGCDVPWHGSRAGALSKLYRS